MPYYFSKAFILICHRLKLFFPLNFSIFIPGVDIISKYTRFQQAHMNIQIEVSIQKIPPINSKTPIQIILPQDY
jgi:hypothetical protein